jgi:ubiquitin-protein ligase
MNPRMKRLENDYRDLRTIFDADPLVEIIAIGPVPSEKYRIVYKVPSLRLDSKGQPIRVDATVVEIELPQGYPKLPPVARTIAGDVVFHPNFNSTKICLADHWAAATQLVDLVREIGEMLQAFERLGIENWLHVSQTVQTPSMDGFGMHGSGLFIVNPPWTLPATLLQVMPILCQMLAFDEGASFDLQSHIV